MKRNQASQVGRDSIERLNATSELTLADLDHVVGGKGAKPSGGSLYSACCTGKHFPTVGIEMT